MLHEEHKYKDPNLKVLFHHQRLRKEGRTVWLHFHQSPEFLLVLEGKILVTCNGVDRIYSPNEIAIINSNDMHKVKPLTDEALYDYFIVDLSICDIGQLPEYSSNIKAIELFKNIMLELRLQEPHYREVVTGYIKVFQSILVRHAAEQAISDIEARKYQYLRKAVNFMYQNFTEDLTLDDICKAIPLSKYYLSHIFKELTGHSILSNLNYIRCNNALSMISTGKYSVAECAYASGFTDPSHFTKMYKKSFGRTPTRDLPRKNKKK